jgi:hypothetical protein
VPRLKKQPILFETTGVSLYLKEYSPMERVCQIVRLLISIPRCPPDKIEKEI